MPTPSFRRATAGDLAPILQLLFDDPLGHSRERVPVAGEAPDECYRRAFDAMDADPNQLFIVAQQGGEIVACLQLTFIPGLSRQGATRAQIESVRVAAGHRNRGIGRRLMSFALDESRRRGCSLAQLTTDKSRPDALRFYESVGFKATHEGMKLAL